MDITKRSKSHGTISETENPAEAAEHQEAAGAENGVTTTMTANDFRKLALSLPEAVENAHMGHPDFRVANKIFATLGPDEDWAMVKLTPAEQAVFVGGEPKGFEPFNGAWGRRGCTKVLLAKARKASLREALFAAWRNTAPKKLVEEYTDE